MSHGRTVNLINVTDPDTFSTSGGSISTIDSLTISASGESANGTSNLIAYRPSYDDNHDSNLGVLFFNMFGIFPCLREAHMTNPVHISCFPTTAEDDGFLGGRAILQAADIGNGFQIFSGGASSERIPTYGLAIQNCPELTSECFPSSFQIHIACFLPRRYCA